VLLLFFINREVDMKKILLVVVATVMAATLNVSVWAADAVPAAAPAAQHPCRVIEDACKGAGFVKGGAAEGKGLWKDCIQPVLGGKTVSGVNITADQVQACKAKQSAKKH
jgi:hypothetical protein